jgi:exopolysaccharide biosynthesis polyprenyl glycosylphosphotransferase
MSNVEARVASALPPSGAKPVGFRGTAYGGPLAAVERRSRGLSVLKLLAGDILSGAAAIMLASVVVTSAWPIVQTEFSDWMWTHVSMTLPLLVGVSSLLGIYRSNVKSLMERFRIRATAMVLFMFAATMMWAREGPSVELAAVPLIGVIALVLGSWTEHLIIGQFVRSGAWGTPTAILGLGAKSRTFARLLLSQPAWGLRPVGFIDDGLPDATAELPAGTEEADPASGLPLLGTIDEWPGGAGPEVVVVPDGHALPRDPEALYRLGVRKILVVSQLGEFASFGLQVRHFDRFVALELGGRPRSLGHGQKRAIDLALALPLAVLTAPMIAFLALMIKFVDPGPALYRQERVGRHGKPIQVLKLRTMYRDAEQRLEHVLATDAAMREQWQRYFKLSRDPRVLPNVGDFLRRTSLDELPQLWNVIRGDMSLVGPRPFPAYHMDAFDPDFQALRVTVLPGLTGLWQISSRSTGDLGVQRAQDCFYIRNLSLWLDLYILIATLPAVIGGQGAK